MALLVCAASCSKPNSRIVDPNPGSSAVRRTKSTTYTPMKSTIVQHGPLIFEATDQIIKASPNQKDFTATYKFKNTGKLPIRILKVKGACSCVVTKLNKDLYESGERGQFDVKLTFGAAVGRFVKALYVYTDESDTKRYKIRIGAMIPMFAKITPRYVRWYRESKPTPELINVKITHNDPIKVIKVDSSNPDYRVKLNTVKEGREYNIELAPKDTREASSTALSIEMNYPADNHLVYRVAARVSHRLSPTKAR